MQVLLLYEFCTGNTAYGVEVIRRVHHGKWKCRRGPPAHGAAGCGNTDWWSWGITL